MKHISTFALVLAFGAASIQARDLHVQMTFSGTQTPLSPQIILAPGAGPAGEATLAGSGSLGPFTYRHVSANTAVPTGFGCAGPNSASFKVLAAAGILRFQDGSLLTFKATSGTQCIDFTKILGTLAFTAEITSGTGLFRNATGTLQVTGLGYPVLSDVTGQLLVLGVVTDGVVTGTIVLPDRED